MTDLTKRLTKRLTDNASYAQEQLAKFANALLDTDQDPTYQFTWADNHFTHAAHIRVCKAALHELEAGKTPEDLVKKWGEFVLNAARNPARSTSPSHNLTDQEVLKVTAELLDWVSDRLDY